MSKEFQGLRSLPGGVTAGLLRRDEVFGPLMKAREARQRLALQKLKEQQDAR